MDLENANIPEWIRLFDIYNGRYVEAKKRGRPFKKNINEDLLVLMREEGHSNRSISRELGIPRRTVDYRMKRLEKEGKV